MPPIEAESTLTDRYQTTVPDAVRRALRLEKRDRLLYRVQDDGTVLVEKKRDAVEDDPIVGAFLAFLAADMAAHPERLRVIDAGLRERIRPLVEGVEFDLDAPLRDEDE